MSNTYLFFLITLVLGLIFFNSLSAPQCVVALFFFKSPAFARRRDPVHTEATISTFLFSHNQFKTFLFSNNFLVPMPPGIISISRNGQFLNMKSLFTLSPPEAEIYFFFSDKVKTLKA